MSGVEVVVMAHAIDRYVERVCPRAAAHRDVVREEIRRRVAARAHRVDPADAEGTWIKLGRLGVAACVKVDGAGLVVVTVVPVAWWLARRVVALRVARTIASGAGKAAEAAELGREIGRRLHALKATPEWGRCAHAADPVRAILDAAKHGPTAQRCAVIPAIAQDGADDRA